MRKLKVGILGCGVISNTYLGDIKNFYPDLEIMACADLVKELAEKKAKEFGIAKAYSPKELLEDKEIEMVINLTPPQCHEKTSKEILLAGKHLFSEKPFAHSLDKAKELLDLAEERGLRVGCAPDTFLASGLQSMKYYLDAGLIGKPFFVTANMTNAGVETWHPNPRPFYMKTGGPIFDMAPYYLSAIVALLGPIEKIAALSAGGESQRYIYTGKDRGSTFETETPTHYTTILNLKSGVVVNLNVSFDIYQSNLPMFEIYGDGGTLTYPDPNFGGGSPKVYRKEQYTDLAYQNTEEMVKRSKHFFELPELYTRAKDYSRGIGVFDLANAIAEGKENRTNKDWILHITEALEGILLASKMDGFYHMKTTCQRPKSLTAGTYLNQI